MMWTAAHDRHSPDRRTDPYTAADIIADKIGLLSRATPET